MTESFADLFEFSQQSLAKLKPGAIVLGTVVEIRADVVVINAGLKSEGIIPIEQFKNDRGELEVAVGDEVKVALDALEDGFGETRLSREKAKRALVWDELEEAHQNNATVVGRSEVYDLAPPPILGGPLKVENITKMDFVVALNIAGQIHDQVRGLPPGTKISGVTIDGEKPQR